MKLAPTILALCLLGPTTALAQAGGGDPFGGYDSYGGMGGGFAPGGFGVSLGVSTLGRTLEPSMRLGDLFGLRAPIGLGNPTFETESESEGVTYTGRASLGGAGVIADFYPLGDGLRLSAGALVTDLGAEFESATINRGGESSRIEVEVDQRRALNPVLALGYEGSLFGAMTWSASAGAILTDGLDVHARETSGRATQGEIDAEIAEIRDTVDGFDTVPFLQLSVGFRF